MLKSPIKACGVKLIVALWLSCVCALQLLNVACAADFQTQQIEIRFRSEKEAREAKFRIEPVYDGYHRAVSCRWDDNWTSDNEGTRDLMQEYGIRGTWYLNDRNFSPENRPADYLPVARKLLEGGNSVGGHSLTHPFVTYYHSNRIFQEMSGVRIAWEAALDRPVVSYAYSFVDLRPGPEGGAVLLRTLDSLKRAGFYHIAEYVSFFDDIELEHELSPIMPPENRPMKEFVAAVDWAYGDENVGRKYPMITNSMHAWYDTPRLPYGYGELRKRFDYLKSLKNVWHCNQNQYAAYRRQYRQSSIVIEGVDDATVRVRLNRPNLLSLDDETPLTISVAGVDSDSIVDLSCSDASIDLSKRTFEDRICFHVSHPDTSMLPEKIGHIGNESNLEEVQSLEGDNDFPDLRGGLSVRDNALHLSLRNDSERKLENIRVRWRAPVGYEIEDPLEHAEPEDTGGVSLDQPIRMSPDSDSRWGREHFAAQVDFVFGGRPGRLHLTCQRDGADPDASLPREGFSVLGPMADDALNADSIVQLTNSLGERAEWTLGDGSQMRWRSQARDGYVTQEWLNPEYVRTSGSWDANSKTYAIRSRVHSPEERTVRIQTSHPSIRTLVLNGERVTSDEATLRKGNNQLLILYPGCTLGVLTQRLTACYVRITDSATGKRCRDISYQAY